MRCLAADKGSAEMLQSCKYGVSFESALMLCGCRSVGHTRNRAAYRGSVVLDCIQPSVFHLKANPDVLGIQVRRAHK